uniref:Putative elongation factor 4 n=1 Tax=Helianthus annuus TaxID=4232 RepID=A0A251VI36_HELAN
MGKKQETVEDVPCGNTVAMVGLDQRALRASTSGQAFPQSVFDHWGMMSFDPLEVGSQESTLVTQIRKRKGLKEQMTPLSEFEDKLYLIWLCYHFF